jgi:Putative peptidoglycan binding domain
LSRALTSIATALVCLLGLGFSMLTTEPARASNAAVDGRSMWIWYMSRSDGGSVPAIVSRARSAGVKTLIIKSADGGHYWSQFSPQLVRELQAAGLHACAWQYVYGTDPIGEAEMGAQAVRAGAECLIIDAETEYEGRYSSAATYLRKLRALVGSGYPVGLASFPYVDYHPAFPYSVFLGPGGAQFDMPQMYWRDINASVGEVFHHTYTYNRIYKRAIYPLGQTYGSPSSGDIQQFRGSTVRYQARGISWWDYAWTSAAGLWPQVSGPYTTVSPPPLGEPVLGVGSSGDDVLWMQEHLAREFPAQRTTGLFASETLADLRAFQARHRLPVSGSTDTATWIALLHLTPVATAWSVSTASVASASRAARANPGSGSGGALAPASASMPARAYEIPELGAQLVSPDPTRAEP